MLVILVQIFERKIIYCIFNNSLHAGLNIKKAFYLDLEKDFGKHSRHSPLLVIKSVKHFC